MKDELLELMQQKLHALQRALILETDAGVKFKLTRQIDELKQQIMEASNTQSSETPTLANRENATMNSSALKQETEKRSIHIFVSYSSRDKELRELLVDGLRAHLAERKDYEYVQWTDEKIDVGANWQEEIEKALKCSDVALLLVDASFAVSNFIKEKELPAFFAKNNKEFLIIPILLREYAFSEFEQISGLQFFKTYRREYGFNKPIERNNLLPFDSLGDNESTTDEQLNLYYKNLADHIHAAISHKFPKTIPHQ